MKEEKGPPRAYELAYLVSPNVPEDKVAEVVSRIKAVLEKQGVFILSDEFPKFRQLAYTLVKPLGGRNEKYTNAYFGWVKFEVFAANLEAIKTDIEREAQLVRFLIVKTEKESKFAAKAGFWRKDTVKRETPKIEVKVPSMTEAEMDKTIEALIVE